MEYISKKDALQLCKSKGCEITPNGLIWVGIKYNISRKAEDGFHWEFNKDGLLKYIKDSKPIKIPKGWITVREAVNTLGVPENTLYSWIRNNKVSSKRIGRPPGGLYVKLQELKKLLKSN